MNSHDQYPTGSHFCVQGLSSDDIRILEFARRWYPYGGGEAEDIMVDFGVSASEFYSRVEYLLLANRSERIGKSVAREMLRVAQARRARR